MRQAYRLFSIAISVAAALYSAACTESGSPTAPTITTPGTTGSSPGSRAILSDPSYSRNIQEIFDRRGCTNPSCHGAAVSAGLDLRAGSSYRSLVGQQATSEPVERVIAGNPDGSLLVIKLEGRQSVGERMPLGGAPLDSIDLTNIRNWIAQGAKDNWR